MTDPTIKFARFVATKFSVNQEGWTYSRDLGGLKYMRFEGDYTGYYHWTKRVARAFNPKEMLGLDSVSKGLGFTPWGRGARDFFMSMAAHIVVNLRKPKHLPDGQVNGNFTFWEEDGEYITLFGPTVGVKVLDFLEAEPDHPHAQAILAEMKRMEQKSWGEDA